MCKVYYVISVRRIMTSRIYALRAAFSLALAYMPIFSDKRQGYTTKDLTKGHDCNIIALTHMAAMPSGALLVQEKRTKPQDPSPQTSRNASPSSGASKRRVVLSARLLRPARRRSGQVRDAAQNACGWLARQPCCPTSGLFEANFLRSTNSVRQWRIACTVTGQKRTSPRSQANRYRDGFCRTADRRATRYEHGRNRRQGVRTLWPAGACEKYQSGPWTARKKNALDRLYDAEQIQALSFKYEQLREVVRTGTSNRRIGLSVLLSQGMWAWVQLLANEVSMPSEAVHTECKAFSTQHIQSSVSRPLLLGILTDMLLGRLAVQEGI